MLSPVDVARVALMEYREHRTLPHLPRHYPDSAGRLLREMDLTVERLDEVLADLDQQARTDPLTGVGNRRRIMERGREFLASAEAQGASVYVGIVDLDDFKGINDRYGHAAGDAVLMGVAKVLQEAIGGHGVVGRLGGDEFCFVLEGCTPEVARSIAEAARMSMAELTSEHFPAGTVHGSIGLARAIAGEGFLQLLRRVDMAVYSAKAGGRDRVELS